MPVSDDNVFLNFIYNIDEKCIDLDATMRVQHEGIGTHFDNMPYAFTEGFVHPDDVDRVIDMYNRIDNGASFATADFRIKNPKGWGRVCLFRPDMSKPYVTGNVQNVSERYKYMIERLEEKENEIESRKAKEIEALQLVRAVSHSSDLLISVNLTNNNFYVINNNESSYAYVCDGHEDAFDRFLINSSKGVCDDFREMFLHTFNRERLLEAYSQGEKNVYLEYKRSNNAGESQWFSSDFMFTENPYNYDVMAIIVRRNINEHKLKEERQKQELTMALLSAEKANNAKSDFLSQMSHDIRTPMNAIVGYTNFALKQTDISVIKNDYLPKIQVSSNHLLTLINDVLEMSRIESGKIDITEEPCHLGEISEDITHIIIGKAQEKSITLHSVADVSSYYVYCDKLRFTQILTNLLGNAIKFTPNFGDITVGFKQEPCDEESHSYYELRVSDTGVGMSEDFAKRVFEPFEREYTSTVTRKEGTGLGLAIVKSIVECMGGTISVESQKGKGTTFIVRLKLRHVEPENISKMQKGNEDNQIEISPENMARMFKGKRLLIVEDNELNRMIAETMLTDVGFEVELAEDGIYAVEMIKNAESEDYYDAVLMDIQMPIMDGYEATKAIRQLSGERSKVKIIAVTANAFKSDVEKALNAGMNSHVSKPIDLNEIYSVLIKEIT